jgi:hypothetical protein
MNVPRNRIELLALLGNGVTASLGVVVWLPSTCYALLVVLLYAINLPDRILPVAAFFTSPIYLVLLLESKVFGSKKLALLIGEAKVFVWPELLLVVVMLMLFLWWIDASFFRSSHTLPFRVLCSFLAVGVVCLASFCVLLLFR